MCGSTLGLTASEPYHECNDTVNNYHALCIYIEFWHLGFDYIDNEDALSYMKWDAIRFDYTALILMMNSIVCNVIQLGLDYVDNEDWLSWM